MSTVQLLSMDPEDVFGDFTTADLFKLIADECHGTFTAPNIIKDVAVEEIEDWLQGWFGSEEHNWEPHKDDGVTWIITEIDNTEYSIELTFL